MTNNFKNTIDSYLSSQIGKLFIRYKNEAKDIDCTEKELGITIDDALKYVLLTYGGAYIGVDLLPCSKDPNNKNQETILDYTKSIRDYYREINVCHSIQSGYVISIEGNGDIIFIDSGTTTCHMIEGLQNKQVTVLTNNLEFLIQAVPYTGLQVFSLSGELDRSTLSFTGPHTLEVLKSYNISKAFMAATGISTHAEVSNTVPAESVVKKLAIARSQEVYLLLDSSKFNQTSMVTYSSFSN